MKKYELLLVLPGTLDENEAETRSLEILTLVKEKDEKAHMDVLGKNRLAYPIKLIRYGYFYTVVFTAEPEDLKYVQDKLGLERDLLRSIISIFNVKSGGNKTISYSSTGAMEKPVAKIKKIVKEKPVSDKKEEILEETKTDKKEEKINKKESLSADRQEKVVKKPAEKVNMEDINKKLDEILDGDIKI